MVGLAAVVGGVMRSPLTGVVFPLELTHAWSLLVPLLIAATTAYLVSALLLKRSVLTEKIARRGLHLSREYAVDPLEVLLEDEVMDAAPLTVAAGERLTDARARADLQRQWLYPVIDEQSVLLGVIPRPDLVDLDGRGSELAGNATLTPRLVTYPDETLRELARRFASEHVTTAVVLDRNDPSSVTGPVTVEHLLQAHLRDLVHEPHRERFPRRQSALYRDTISRHEIT